MQTYRRLASTATSTSRSASSSMHHQHPHAHNHPHSHSHSSRLSRSSSSTSSAVSPNSLTPVDVGSYGRMGMGVPISTGIIRNTSYASPTNTSDYTRAELETIAESLLAHVNFGPYHLASSPVPTSHLRHAMSNTKEKENASINGPINNSSFLSSSSASINNASSPTPTLNQLGYSRYDRETVGPSSRRHFEGKEGSERGGNHPRARFTIGGGESERGRGMARKSVGLSVRDVTNHGGDYGFDLERGREGREGRGRSGDVKGLQQYP